VRSGKNSAAKSGKIVTTYPMYGYEKDTNNHHRFVVHAEDSRVVKHIYDLAEQGVRIAEITRILNSESVPTPQMSKHKKGFVKEWGRGDCWVESVIKRILTNECYTGKWIWGRTRTTQIGTTKSKAVPRSEWIIVPDAFPALVTEEQFNVVQTRLAANAKKIINKTTTRPKAIFKRIVKCGYCGRCMNRWSRKDRLGVFYCDMPRHSDKFTCNTGKIEESDLVEVVLSALQRHIAVFDAARASRKTKAKSAIVTRESVTGDILNLKKLIEQSKSTKMTLWENFHGGALSREKFQSESEKVTAQVKAYENRLAELNDSLGKLKTESEMSDALATKLSKLTGIEMLTEEVVNEFVSEIKVYSPDRIEVVFNFADEFAKLEER
jgi:hypothetical protein